MIKLRSPIAPHCRTASLLRVAGGLYTCFRRRARALERNSTTLPTGLEVPKQLYVAGIAVGVRMSWTDGACLGTKKAGVYTRARRGKL